MFSKKKKKKKKKKFLGVLGFGAGLIDENKHDLFLNWTLYILNQ
ncbi:hypothetical protein [Mycoplasmoides gallisepticum]|nr:hypothetical protein [Mycoplasmoides gallisepticum]